MLHHHAIAQLLYRGAAGLARSQLAHLHFRLPATPRFGEERSIGGGDLRLCLVFQTLLGVGRSNGEGQNGEQNGRFHSTSLFASATSAACSTGANVTFIRLGWPKVRIGEPR